ncbi:uncharacterized protein LOC108151737 isoform X2 [Drosophila miranda]|uniref:uncharacterized protein LOC108151737 isoform X2 n=1 Tax=Drosophila miranda TaxID=7229 RepID=UPI00143FAB90|nr:uncharacterized protein LOC108151737 isoform X2 [Drosophila miranda]
MKQKEGELVKQFYILWRKYFDWAYPVRDQYTIWQFTLPSWHGVKAALEGLLPMILFFYVLAVAISNWLSAISWPQTNWITPSKNMLHMFWAAKELVMFLAWNYLLYGLVWDKPELLYRWQLLSGSVLLVDILFLTRARWGHGYAILTCYLVPLWNIYCVNSVRISTEQFIYSTTMALNRTQGFFGFEIFEHLLYFVHT